ncbi:TRAP transporter small permease [Parathalassolituus penaei]|uniref:TRAP transporter small permease protein n=1 Tax=Parathalassolituus penaei TaxID=2997323 RepID=A0A9X3EEE0_9GAMM|nr:TRAP transporter small permease [Parathalassolituus penaei]MCY0965655.1 TRAP transporter small permease [Parathalassolituus penaei]
MNIAEIPGYISLLMYRLAALILVVIMLIICADVTLRWLFGISDGAIDMTFSGGIEMVRFGLMFAMLLAFPHAVDKGQIIVDIFTAAMNSRYRDILDGIYLVLFGGLAALLCWRFTDAAEMARLNAEKTQDLQWPLEWLYGPAALILVMVALQAVLAGIRLLRHREHHQEVHV